MWFYKIRKETHITSKTRYSLSNGLAIALGAGDTALSDIVYYTRRYGCGKNGHQSHSHDDFDQRKTFVILHKSPLLKVNGKGLR